MVIKTLPKSMVGAILLGNSAIELKKFEILTVGYGQVLVKTKATTICGIWMVR